MDQAEVVVYVVVTVGSFIFIGAVCTLMAQVFLDYSPKRAEPKDSLPPEALYPQSTRVSTFRPRTSLAVYVRQFLQSSRNESSGLLEVDQPPSPRRPKPKHSLVVNVDGVQETISL